MRSGEIPGTIFVVCTDCQRRLIGTKLTVMMQNHVSEHWSCRGGNDSRYMHDEIAVGERNVTCLCHCCGTWLVFQAFREGEMVNCPQCLMGTILHMPEQRPKPAMSETDFQFRKLGWGVTKTGHRSIIGELFNSSNRGFDWVRLQFTLYNSIGIPIGITSDLLIGFRAGAAWKFSAPVFESSVIRSSLPLLSTEYGTQRGPKPSKANRPHPLQDLSDSEYSAEAGIQTGHIDTLMGKPGLPEARRCW